MWTRACRRFTPEGEHLEIFCFATAQGIEAQLTHDRGNSDHNQAVTFGACTTCSQAPGITTIRIGEIIWPAAGEGSGISTDPSPHLREQPFQLN